MDIKAHTLAAQHSTSVGTSGARKAAEDLEAALLFQVLSLSGVGKAPGSFGGGEGEQQFTSFLVEEYAQRIVQAGGIGLAENIFQQIATHKTGA